MGEVGQWGSTSPESLGCPVPTPGEARSWWGELFGVGGTCWKATGEMKRMKVAGGGGGGVAGVLPHPGVALPSSLTGKREGNMGGRWGHRVGRRLGTCLAGHTQSGFVAAGGGSTGHGACASGVCVGMGRPGLCGRTKGDAEAGPSAPILPTPLATLGQAGPQGWGCPAGPGQGWFGGAWGFCG